MFSADQKLTDKKIAILATDGFEEAELFEPKKALEAAGAHVDVISFKSGKIRAWKDDDWGKTIAVDQTIFNSMASDYDALMLPGGVINADKVRAKKEAVEFVRDFVEAGKPIAAICHAAWTLIETGYMAERKLTSWPSLKTDLRNAGATWVDEEVVVDHGWVTSRKPDDLLAFNERMIQEFQVSRHESPSHSSKDLSSRELSH